MQLYTGVSSGRGVVAKPRLQQSYPNEPVASVFSPHKDTEAHAARDETDRRWDKHELLLIHTRDIQLSVCQQCLKNTSSLFRGITVWTVRWELQLYVKRVNEEHLYSARSQWYPEHQTPDRTLIEMDTFFVEVGGKLEHFTGTSLFVMVLPLK